MGRKHCGTGEIARYEQFLLFTQCFQKACFPGSSKGVIVWEWVKRVYLLRFCTKYDTRFSKCPTDFIVALSSTNATKNFSFWKLLLFTIYLQAMTPVLLATSDQQPLFFFGADSLFLKCDIKERLID